MQISEVANLLSFPEDHIRLYIKQDLIPGIKRSDKSPDITERDIVYIKRVIILRRLRWRFIDIAGYMHGKASLFKTAESIAKLMNANYERKIRPDFYILTKQIADEKNPQLDTDRYWELINNSDELRNDFVEPELNLKKFILSDHPKGYISDANKATVKSTVSFLLCIFLLVAVLDFIKNRSILTALSSVYVGVIAFCAITIFKVLLFFARRFLGAKIFHGFVAVITIILCIIVSLAAVLPLIFLY